MSITVRGIKIRSNDVKGEMKTSFNSLKEFAQKRLLKEHLDLFFADALASKYPNVRKLAMELKEDCSSETLNKIIRAELKDTSASGFEHYDYDLVFEILNCKQLKLDEDLRERLSVTEIWKIRKWVAQDINTSNKMLNDMIFRESRDFIFRHSVVVFDSIVLNPNFKMIEKTKRRLIDMFTVDSYDIVMERVEKIKNEMT